MSYLKNKIKRMRTKYSNILMKDFGMKLSDTATEIVVICNGGLCNGITHEMVCNTFGAFGDLENVVMVPKKSYCFVKFKSSSNAIASFNKLNAENIWPEIKGPIYLGFVQEITKSLFTNCYNFTMPPGLILIEDFITEEEEKFLLKLVGFNSGEENTSELKHRKVKHFGYEFKYSTNNVDLNEPIEKIPSELNFLWERLKERNIEFVPDQLTVNCYEPGQGIPPHVDTHSAFQDGILSLSLESTIVMDFRNEKDECCNVVLPRWSLCAMFHQSRYDWTHGITPRKSDVVLNSRGCLTVKNRQRRTSLTFRKTRKGNCNCDYKRLCDSYLKRNIKENILDMKSISLKKELSSELEGNFVHNVYDKIAWHFSETRQKPWPNVMKFVNSFGTGSILVDVGCGNGKYFTKEINRFEIGCDSSIELLKLCKKQEFECFSCNCLQLPIRDNVADGCICIAVIHHLTTHERRKKAILEMIRIIKKKGKILIYVWAKNQEKEKKKSNYLKQLKKSEKKENLTVSQFKEISLHSSEEKLIFPVHVNRTNFSHNDLLVPWKLKNVGKSEKRSENENENENENFSLHLRYYHVFEDDELKGICEEIKEVDILDYYYDQGNWCILLQKN